MGRPQRTSHRGRTDESSNEPDRLTTGNPERVPYISPRCHSPSYHSDSPPGFQTRPAALNSPAGSGRSGTGAFTGPNVCFVSRRSGQDGRSGHGCGVRRRVGDLRVRRACPFGSRSCGAYEAGALSILLPLLTGPDSPRVIVGSSVGALNAAMLASVMDNGVANAAESLLEAWRRITPEKVFAAPRRSVVTAATWHLHHQPRTASGLLDTTPLEKTIGEMVDTRKLDRTSRADCSTALASLLVPAQPMMRSCLWKAEEVNHPPAGKSATSQPSSGSNISSLRRPFLSRFRHVGCKAQAPTTGISTAVYISILR